MFIPHAVERELTGDVSAPRSYDVVVLASPIDYRTIRMSWKTEFSESIIDLLLEAAELSLHNPALSPVRAFAKLKGLNRANGTLSLGIVKYAAQLSALENYVRGVDRLRLVNAVKSGAVHVFGDADHGRGWEDLLQRKGNVKIHPSVPFEEAQTVMKDAKIVLSSCAWIRDGAHERIFNAMACGALVIAERTPYLEESFAEGKEILFYDLGHWEKIDSLVNYYLRHDDERMEIARRGQKKVKACHTWDHRAYHLVKELDLRGIRTLAKKK